MAPTPLAANSFDDNGVLVRNRTDVAVCEGYPLALDLSVPTPKKKGSNPQIDNANRSNRASAVEKLTVSRAVKVQCSPEQPMSTSNEEVQTRVARPFTSKFD